jgi:hypothetical protein
MTCSAMHRGRLLAIAGGVLFVAVGCPQTRVSPESVWYVEPIPESGDEQTGRTPPREKLGGPYGNPTKVEATHKETAGAPVMLTPTVNEQVLVDYLDKLRFDMARDNGELAVVRCPQGRADECHALLYIQPEIGMIMRSHGDMPRYGMVIARIINYSISATDITYRIPPLTRAYWYVYPTNDGPRSRLFIRTPGSGTTLRFLEPEKEYRQCGHKYIGFAAVARLRKCEQDDRTGGSNAKYGARSNPLIRSVSLTFTPRSSVVADDAAVALDNTELWVKCAQGCCIAGP